MLSSFKPLKKEKRHVIRHRHSVGLWVGTCIYVCVTVGADDVLINLI
jgi:hypothetical protein